MSNKEKFEFQTEIKQLLNLVINSLYSNREIFLRELISNSLDACEKLRYESLKSDLSKKVSSPRIRIVFNTEDNTIEIQDNGIGMSREEIVENLGTIAKSGTKKFLEDIKEQKKSQLIGHFGIGFYSAYIVSERVIVKSLKFGSDNSCGVSWESSVDGSFTVKNIEKSNYGTTIILFLKEKSKDLCNGWKLREIIKKYSNHSSISIEMLKTEYDKEGKEIIKDDWETVNTSGAIWTKNKTEVKDQDYIAFYKSFSYDYTDPLLWSHSKVEGNLEYTSLLYIPTKAPFDLWDNERKSGISLYSQRVFIMNNNNLLPSYLRFVKGIVDSNDISLNVSREILQKNEVVHKIRKSMVKKLLDLLKKVSIQEPEKYRDFWRSFGQVIKEGPAEDYENKQRISNLLRFSSTHSDIDDSKVSFEDYLSRMKSDQKYIYYITSESFNAARNNPQLEIFRKKSVEVLLLSDRVDEWMISHLDEVQGKKLKSITKGNLDLGSIQEDSEKKLHEETREKFKDVLTQMKKVLGDRVSEVNISTRLTNSPSCIVVSENGMSMHLQKMMSDAGRSPVTNNNKPSLEINFKHQLIIEKIKNNPKEESFSDWTHILYNQALLSEGAQLEDPSSFVVLLNKYLN